MPKLIKAEVEMVEVDRTIHDLEMHRQEPREHTKLWYSAWGNKCPDCKAPATIAIIKREVQDVKSLV